MNMADEHDRGCPAFSSAPGPLIGVVAAGLVYLMGFYPPVAVGIHDAQRVFVSVALAASLFAVPAIARGVQLAWLSALAGVMALATVWQPSVTGAALYLSWLGLLAWGWHLYGRARAQPMRAQSLWSYVVVGMALAYAVRISAAMAAAVPREEVLLKEIFLGFGHIRHFAQLIPPLLPVLAYCCLRGASGTPSVSRALRPLGALALLCWCVLLWLNGSAGALYGTLIGLVFAVAIAGWQRARPLILTMLAAGVVAVAVVLGLDYLVPLVGEIAQSARMEESGRFAIWADSARALAERPLLGWGPARFPEVIDARVGHPHNAELAFAMDFGLIALAFLLVVMWRWFSPLRLAGRIRSMSVRDAQWPVALTAASFGSLAHAQVSGVTVMPLAQLVLASTLALLLAAVDTAPQEVVHSRIARTIGVLAGTALAVSVALSAVLAPCGPFAAQEVRCEMRPSFWSRAPT